MTTLAPGLNMGLSGQTPRRVRTEIRKITRRGFGPTPRVVPPYLTTTSTATRCSSDGYVHDGVAYDEYEASNQLLFTRITDPSGKVTRLGYDQFGRLRQLIDAANNATVYGLHEEPLDVDHGRERERDGYEYDARKRLSATVFPDGARESYTYRNDGLLETRTDRRGIVTSFEYDAQKPA